jgi:hypothetical protein
MDTKALEMHTRVHLMGCAKRKGNPCSCGSDQAAYQLEQLKASRDGWKNSAETAYKRVMELSAERDEMRKLIENLMYMPRHNHHDNLQAMADYLAKYPGGEK